MKLTALGLPRVVWLLAASRFFSAAGSFVMLFLTLYLTGPRGLSAPIAGLVVGASGAGNLIGYLHGGRWGDRLGHRRVLLTATTAGALGIMTVPWQPSAVLALTLPIIGYLQATGSVSSGALAALAMPRGDRRTAVAVSRSASNAGFVIGPLLGALLVAHSYDAIFLVDGGVLLAVRLFVVRALPAEPTPVTASDAGHESDMRANVIGMWRSLLGRPDLLWLVPAIVLADLVYRQLYTTVPVQLRDAGQPVALYSALIAIGSALILLFEVLVALRLRGQRSLPIIAAGYALIGVGFGLFGLPISVVSAVVAMLVLTTGEILYKTTATAHVQDAAPDHLIGQYHGLYTGLSTSGGLISAPLGLGLYAVAPHLLWPACAVVGFVAAGLALHSDRVAQRH